MAEDIELVEIDLKKLHDLTKILDFSEKKNPHIKEYNDELKKVVRFFLDKAEETGTQDPKAN